METKIKLSSEVNEKLLKKMEIHRKFALRLYLFITVMDPITKCTGNGWIDQIMYAHDMVASISKTILLQKC